MNINNSLQNRFIKNIIYYFELMNEYLKIVFTKGCCSRIFSDTWKSHDLTRWRRWIKLLLFPFEQLAGNWFIQLI